MALTTREAAALLDVVCDAREGMADDLHFRHSLGHNPALADAIRKLGALAGAPDEKIAWLVSRPKLLTDPD